MEVIDADEVKRWEGGRRNLNEGTQVKVGKEVAGEIVIRIGKVRSWARCRCSESQRDWAYLL